VQEPLKPPMLSLLTAASCPDGSCRTRLCSMSGAYSMSCRTRLCSMSEAYSMSESQKNFDDHAMFMAAQPRLVLDAAADLHAAAATFGPLQEQAAQAYTYRLLVDDGTPPSSLIDLQTDLFSSCLVLSDCALVDSCVILEPASGHPAAPSSHELTAAMDKLRALVNDRRASEAEDSFGLGALIRIISGREAEIAAAAREVTSQAARFGPTQRDAAAEWVHRLVVRREPLDNAALLDQRIALFGECRLSTDVGTSACVELNAAVAKLSDLRALLVAQAAADEDVASNVAARATEQSRQTTGYRNLIPDRLVAWGCDRTLWRKIKNRTVLRKLARIDDEAHGRQRIASLRAKLIGT